MSQDAKQEENSSESEKVDLRLTLSGEHLNPDLNNFFGGGVGLLRSEYPLRRIGAGFSLPEAKREIAAYVEQVVSAAAPKAVWYRMADLWSDEANPLKGVGRIYKESNPLVGVRGIRRALKDHQEFQDELSTILPIARTHKNLHLLTPFVADAEQFGVIVDKLEKIQWPNKIGTMVEIPSAVLGVKQLVAKGASNLLIGLNDLTSLLLGADRSSGFYSKDHPAVTWALQTVADAVGSQAEWGVGGKLESAHIEKAQRIGAHYVSIHYHQAASLCGVDQALLPEMGLVDEIRMVTKQRALAFELNGSKRLP